MDRMSEAIRSVQELLGYSTGGYPPGKSPFADDPHRWRKTGGDDAACGCKGDKPVNKQNGHDHMDPAKRQYFDPTTRIRPRVLTYISRR